MTEAPPDLRPVGRPERWREYTFRGGGSVRVAGVTHEGEDGRYVLLATGSGVEIAVSDDWVRCETSYEGGGTHADTHPESNDLQPRAAGEAR